MFERMQEKHPEFSVYYITNNPSKKGHLPSNTLRSLLIFLRAKYGTNLHIIGPNQKNEYIQFIRELIERRKLVNIIFTGRIPNDKLPDALMDKSFFVNSSLIESCLVSLLEAMASGLIPLVRNWPSASEFLSNAFVFNSFSEMNQKIKTFLEFDDDKRRILRNEFRKQILENFTIEKQMSQFIKIFKLVS